MGQVLPFQTRFEFNISPSQAINRIDLFSVWMETIKTKYVLRQLRLVL